jgi:hypothetical protein
MDQRKINILVSKYKKNLVKRHINSDVFAIAQFVQFLDSRAIVYLCMGFSTWLCPSLFCINIVGFTTMTFCKFG